MAGSPTSVSAPDPGAPPLWVVAFDYDMENMEYIIGKIVRAPATSAFMDAPRRKGMIIRAKDELEAYTEALRMLRAREQGK